MKHIAYGMSNPGRVRKQNEDSFLVDELLGLYVVCDGVGGHAAGEVASQTACRVIQQAIMRNRSRLDAYLLKPSESTRQDAVKLINQAISAASREVHQLAVKNPKMRGMATTLVMLVVVGDSAILAHVGDSRIYLLRNDRVHQLSDDHSLSNEQAKRGNSVSSGGTARSETLMTRAVGFHSSVQADTLFIDLLTNDKFLLCSDGASDYFTQGNEFKHFVDKHELSDVPAKIIDYANESGGKDNITALVINTTGHRAKNNRMPARRLEALEKAPIFKNLEYRELLRLVYSVKVQEFTANKLVIKEGDPGEAAYICAKGSLRVEQNKQLITTLVAGDFFGEMALVDDSPRSANVIANEDSVILVIPRESIFEIVRRDARLALKLIWSISRLLSSRLREANEHLAWTRSTLDNSLAGFDLLMKGKSSNSDSQSKPDS